MHRIFSLDYFRGNKISTDTYFQAFAFVIVFARQSKPPKLWAFYHILNFIEMRRKRLAVFEEQKRRLMNQWKDKNRLQTLWFLISALVAQHGRWRQENPLLSNLCSSFELSQINLYVVLLYSYLLTTSTQFQGKWFLDSFFEISKVAANSYQLF